MSSKKEGAKKAGNKMVFFNKIKNDAPYDFSALFQRRYYYPEFVYNPDFVNSSAPVQSTLGRYDDGGSKRIYLKKNNEGEVGGEVGGEVEGEVGEEKYHSVYSSMPFGSGGGYSYSGMGADEEIINSFTPNDDLQEGVFQAFLSRISNLFAKKNAKDEVPIVIQPESSELFVSSASNTETPHTEFLFALCLYAVITKTTIDNNIEQIAGNMTQDKTRFECAKIEKYLQLFNKNMADTDPSTQIFIFRYISNLFADADFRSFCEIYGSSITKIVLSGKGKGDNPSDVHVELNNGEKIYFSVKTTTKDRTKNPGWSQHMGDCMSIVRDFLKSNNIPTGTAWTDLKDSDKKSQYRDFISENFFKGSDNPYSIAYWKCLDEHYQKNISDIAEILENGVTVPNGINVYLYNGTKFSKIPNKKDIIISRFFDDCDSIPGIGQTQKGTPRQACKSYKYFIITFADGTTKYYKVEMMHKGNYSTPSQLVIFPYKECSGGKCVFTSNKSGGGSKAGGGSRGGFSSTEGGSRKHKRKSLRRRKTRRSKKN